MLINFNACSWLLSLSSWSLPSLFLAFTCTKREYCLCIQLHKPQKLFHMSTPYLPICGIYLPFQVNLYVPNSKPSNKHSVLYAWIAHISTRVVCIFWAVYFHCQHNNREISISSMLNTYRRFPNRMVKFILPLHQQASIHVLLETTSASN